MIQIGPFRGEIPKSEPRDLPNGFATAARDCRLDRGVLEPLFQPGVAHTFGSNVQTVYRADDGTWLGWNADVDVAPGPIAADRLYVTGDGVPKLRLTSGAVRDLALPFPADRLAAGIIVNTEEYLYVSTRTVRLAQGVSAVTSGGVRCRVSIDGTTATVTMTHNTGLSTADAAALVNSLQYRSTQGPASPGIKLVSITEIRDDGGQDYDDDRNPLGSDTRYIDGLTCKVFVGGTTRDVTLPTVGAQDATNESGQNDPPILTATPLHPTYAAAGDAAVNLFSGAAVSTIEGGQLIIRLVVEIEGLTNGAIDPATSQSLLYSYTHVTDLDEESAPALLTKPVLWSPGHSARLTGFSLGSAARGVNRYRIYRSQSGASGDTTLYFVGEIARGTTSFIDVPDDVAIGEPITTMDFSTPPDGLKGIVSMPNGMMAAFTGKALHFCEPYKPHAWPAKYMLTVDYQIVGLASIGSALAIMTQGTPYLAQGSHPDNMRAEAIQTPLPCSAKKSIVPLSYGVAYASPDGLVVMNAQGGAEVVTRNLYTGRQWLVDMNPATFVAGRLDDLYALAYDPDAGGQRMAFIDLSGTTPFVSRASDTPVSFFTERGTGRLFYLDSDVRTVRLFDPTVTGAARRTYRWISRLYVDAGATNLGAAYIECDDDSGESFSVRLYGDGVLRATVSTANQIMSLPGGYRARRWQIDVEGSREINSIIFAHAAPEIARLVR